LKGEKKLNLGGGKFTENYGGGLGVRATDFTPYRERGTSGKEVVGFVLTTLDRMVTPAGKEGRGKNGKTGEGQVSSKRKDMGSIHGKNGSEQEALSNEEREESNLHGDHPLA